MQADSLQTSLDTTRTLKLDTVKQPKQVDIRQADTSPLPIAKKELPVKGQLKPVVKKAPVIVKQIATDTIGKTKVSSVAKIKEPIKLFSTLTNRDSSEVKTKPQKIVMFTTETPVNYEMVARSGKQSKEKEWVFSLGLAAFILIIVVQVYYKKQFAAVQSALFNMQLADKLMREKNVMLKRLYFLLNTMYIFSLSLFLYQVVSFTDLNLAGYKGFGLYSAIFAIVFTIILFRYVFNRIVAFLFEAESIFREYDYNNLIINKNLGVVLLPILLSSYFVPLQLVPFFFVLAAILIIMAILLRYFKAVQLIMKHNVFLFYSILYLCTLEILPVLVGVKYALTLR